MNKKIFSKNCNLSSYTTIKVGGVAEYFAEPRSINEFSYLIKWANLNKQRCQIIGAGSNLLINNIFIKGLVICTKKLKSLKIEPYSGIVEAIPEYGSIFRDFNFFVQTTKPFMKILFIKRFEPAPII